MSEVTVILDRLQQDEPAAASELLPLKGHSGTVFSVAFARNGQRIVTGSDDHTIKVWEAASAEQVAIWNKEEETESKAIEPPANISP